MTAYDAFALTLLALMTVGVWACALHLSRLSELRADDEIRRAAEEVLTWPPKP